MSDIVITADSTCDLSAELLKKYQIKIIPLYNNMDDRSYQDGIEIGPTDIFEYAARTGRLPKTASVLVQEYINTFSKYAAEGRAVIHINIGSKFSSCFQNACTAAGQFKNVFVVDSENLSTGSGHLAITAAIMAHEGRSPQEIVDCLRGLIPRVEMSFLVDTLEYLRMGGRCSSVAALGANLLNIKPCIEVRNGAMSVGKKYRGRIDKSIEKYVVDRLENRRDIAPERILINHTGCSEEVIENTKQLIRQYYDFNEIIETMSEADGIIMGSPVYFTDVTAGLKGLIERAGYVSMANGHLFKHKVGAAVTAVRRGGAIHAFDTINHFYQWSQMFIAGSTKQKP
jgi:DegV family protein with EDD domain